MGSDGIYGEKSQVKEMYPEKSRAGKLLNLLGRTVWQHSINHSHFYSNNIPCIAGLSGVTAKSVLNSKIDGAVPQCQQVIEHASVYGRKTTSKRYILRHFLKVETEVDERTDSGKLFQRKGAQELNDRFSALVSTLGTDKVIRLFDLSERDGSGVASKECR